MLSFHIQLANPFKHDSFRDIWQREYRLSEHKRLEIGFYRYAWNWFELALDLRWRGRDHAGPSFEIGIFGYTGRIGICDNRHWNSLTNNWEVYD